MGRGRKMNRLACVSHQPLWTVTPDWVNNGNSTAPCAGVCVCVKTGYGKKTNSCVCVCIRSRSGHSTPRISHRERPSVFQSITFADSLKERKVKQDSLPDCSSIFNDSRYFQQRGCGAHTLCRGTDSVQLAPKSSVKTHTQPCSSAAKRDEMKADVCPGLLPVWQITVVKF